MSDALISDNPLVRRAIDVVGWNEPGNRSFHAGEFVAHHIEPLRCFLPESRPLIEILESVPVQVAVAHYEAADNAAIRAQKAYIRGNRCIAAPLLVSAIAGMVVVVVPPGVLGDVLGYLGWSDSTGRFGEAVARACRIYAPWVVYVGLIVAAALSHVLTPMKHFRNWKQNRATAEAMRCEIFRRIVSHDSAATDESEDTWIKLLKLEYFRRWQAELQRDYFDRQGQRHLDAVRNRARWQKMAVAVFVILGLVLLASLGASGDEQGLAAWPLHHLYACLSHLHLVETLSMDWWLLSFGLLAVTVFVYFFMQSELTDAKRHAPRFINMRENFDVMLGWRLANARAGVAGGTTSIARERALREYVERVHAVMALELCDWVRLADLDIGIDRHLGDAGSSPAAQSVE